MERWDKEGEFSYSFFRCIAEATITGVWSSSWLVRLSEQIFHFSNIGVDIGEMQFRQTNSERSYRFRYGLYA